MSHNYLNWTKYQNRHSSKSIWVMKLFFWQNYPLMGQSFWQKNSFITHILFEPCQFVYLAQSTYLWDTLYKFHNLKLSSRSLIVFNIFQQMTNFLRNSSVRITWYVNYIFSYEHAYYLKNFRLCHALQNAMKLFLKEHS